MTSERTQCSFCMRSFMNRAAQVHVFREAKKRGQAVQSSQFMQMMFGATVSYDISFRIKIKCSEKTGALKCYSTEKCKLLCLTQLLF